MRRALGALACVGLLALATASGCKSEQAQTVAAAPKGAAPIGLSECKACSMVVREQPAPRGQLVRRDGTREHFCSIDDLLQTLPEPSPHGEAVEIYVESTDPALDPKQTPSAERPWLPAAAVSYVVGVARDGIMGPPVLTYDSPDQARAVVERVGGEIRTWKALASEGVR